MTTAEQPSLPAKGMESNIPPGVERQARKVVELRDEMELAKARLKLATEILHSRMRKAGVYDVPLLTEAGRVTLRATQPDEKVTIEGYHRPEFPGDALMPEAEG